MRTARAWLYKEQLREILERKQINIVRSGKPTYSDNLLNELSAKQRSGT